MTDGTSPRVRAACALLAFALGLAACLSRDLRQMPLTLDNQHYFFVAERAASGVPPHVSHFDSKNALSLLISGAAIRAGRAVGVKDVMAARAVSLLAVAGAAALAWLAAVAVSGRLLAGHLAALALLGLEPYVEMGAMGARPKVFLVFFALATLWAVARRRPFAAGLAGAAAFLCWQPALWVPAAAVPVWAAGPRRARALGLFGFAALLAVALYEGYFAAHGALGEQLEQAFRFPALYMAGASGGRWVEHARGILRLGAERAFAWVLPVWFALVLAGSWAAALRRPRALPGLAAERPGLAFAVLAATGALAFSLFEYQTVIDAFLLQPFVAVLGGWGAVALLDRVTGAGAPPRPEGLRGETAGGSSERPPEGVRSARGGAAPPAEASGSAAKGLRLALSLALVLGFATLASWRPSRGWVGATLADQERAARAVGAMRARGESVWAVGCTHLLALNRQDNHVRYGFFFRGMDRYLQDRFPGPEGYRPLRDGRPPDVILVSRPFLPGGRAWLEREYAPAPVPVLRQQGIQVWHRRAEPASRPHGETRSGADAASLSHGEAPWGGDAPGTRPHST